MKKILMLLFPIVCALLIIGCTNSGANENAKKYYYDENVHYKVDKNGEYIDVEEHTFIKDYCYICDVHISIKDMLFKLINNEQEYAITSSSFDGKIIIPREYNGLPVTTIYSRTFSNSKDIIEVPNSIVKVDENAFNSCNIYLEHTEIPKEFDNNWFSYSTVYLGYEEGKYKIDFINDSNNKYGVFANYGDTLPKHFIPSKYGCSFIGYFDQLEGGKQYYDENMVCVNNWDKYNDFSLYPHWKSAEYTIIFEANGGDGKMEPMKITYEDSYNNETPLASNTFEHSRRVFLGWSLSNDSEVQYKDKSSTYEIIYDCKPNDKDTITLYAVWSNAINFNFDYTYAQSKTFLNKNYNVLSGVRINNSYAESYGNLLEVSSNCTINDNLLDTSQSRTCKIDYYLTYEMNGKNYIYNSSRNVEVIQPTIVEGNLVANGCFEYDLDHWGFTEKENAVGSLSSEHLIIDGEEKYVAKVVMSNNTLNYYDNAKLTSASCYTNDITKAFTLEANKTYKVSFKAKSLREIGIRVSLAKLFNEKPWYDYFTNDYQKYVALVTSDWQEFTFEFTADHMTLEQCSILFDFTDYSPTNDVVTTIWLTDVYVGECVEHEHEINIATIESIHAGSYYYKFFTVEGMVTSVYSRGFVTYDGTGSILTYLGVQPNVKVGDYVRLMGDVSDYMNVAQFTQNTIVEVLDTDIPNNKIFDFENECINYGPIELENNAGGYFARLPYIRIIGTLTKSGKYYDVIVEGTDTIANLMYPSENYDNLVGQKVEVYGFLVYKDNSGTCAYVSVNSIEIYEEKIYNPKNIYIKIKEEWADVYLVIYDELGQNVVSRTLLEYDSNTRISFIENIKPGTYFSIEIEHPNGAHGHTTIYHVPYNNYNLLDFTIGWTIKE